MIENQDAFALFEEHLRNYCARFYLDEAVVLGMLADPDALRAYLRDRADYDPPTPPKGYRPKAAAPAPRIAPQAAAPRIRPWRPRTLPTGPTSTRTRSSR